MGSIIDLNKYYVLLMLDVDDMGKWLSGKFPQNKEKESDLKGFHKILSGQLREFSQAVSKDIFQNETKGRLVYAGGDDVLAFVNINYLFDVIKSIQGEFKKVQDEIGKELTFSAGMVIAHYKSPLSEVISWARKMEKEAKSVKDKDAFGLALMTHSGNMVKTVGKWGDFDFLQDCVKLSNNFTDKYVFSFKKGMLPVFEGATWELGELDDVYNMVFTELKRLLLRGKKIEKDAAIQIINNLKDGINSFVQFNLQEVDFNYRFDMNNFTALLEVARFLSKEMCERKLQKIYEEGGDTDESA